MHLHTLVRLWRLLKAPLLGRSYGTGSLCDPRLRRYLYIVAAWRDHTPGLHGDMLEPNRLLNPLDAGTSRSPDWWFSARSAKEIRGNLALDIRTLNARYKRKYWSLRSASIRDQVLKRQERLLNGRMRIALVFLLGKRKSSFLFETLLCVDGSHDADPVSIYRTIQSHYMRYFSAVPENLLQRLDLDLPDLASAHVWETFSDHLTVMADAFLNLSGGQAQTAVPAEYVHAVARAFQRTPAAIDMEAELSASLETPFSFVEFLHALMGRGSLGLPTASFKWRRW
jgi:hypothetical protein